MSDILHQADQQQFVCTVDGKLSRLAYRRLDATTVDAYSTQVPPELRGQGISDPRRGGRRNDQFVQVVVEVPKKLNKKQEELLRQLTELEKANVSPHRKSFFKKLKSYFES